MKAVAIIIKRKTGSNVTEHVDVIYYFGGTKRNFWEEWGGGGGVLLVWRKTKIYISATSKHSKFNIGDEFFILQRWMQTDIAYITIERNAWCKIKEYVKQVASLNLVCSRVYFITCI